MRVRIALTAVLGLAGGLRLWGLTQNGFGNAYYAATVRSMASSAHNFFYASFDPAGCAGSVVAELLVPVLRASLGCQVEQIPERL